MSNDPKTMVEPQKHEHKPARNLVEAANSDETLEGYASVNGLTEDEETASLAYKFYQERQTSGLGNSADDDWFRAQAEVRNKRTSGAPK